MSLPSSISSSSVALFLALTGKERAVSVEDTPSRILGAKLLLSEVLEYVIRGLGVDVSIDGVAITDPEAIQYSVSNGTPDSIEMLDGLADVTYTTFWNALHFGMPLELAFARVCENNLTKFIRLPDDGSISPGEQGTISRSDIESRLGPLWPPEVQSVEIVRVGEASFAVGKDGSGKVRKPLSYSPVDLADLVAR